MRIGIVAEGSYPYVRGGVASWVHMLIAQMPEHTFTIISIMPGDFKEVGTYKYDLPSNVDEIITYRLGEPTFENINTNLTKEEEQNLLEWFRFERYGRGAFSLLGNVHKLGSMDEFFHSRSFWEIVQKSYEAEKQSSSFLEYFWMFKSMYTPIINLLQRTYPKVDVIHSVSTGYAGLIGAYMKETQKVPYILTEHGIYSREREEEILQADWIPSVYKSRWINYFHHISMQAYDKADDIITLFEKNSYHQKLIGAPEKKFSIIPNGIEIEKYMTVKRESETEDQFHIGAIVRVVPIKDVKTMIYAARMLADDEISFFLTIMGPLDEDEDYAEECLQLIKRLKLEGYVSLAGQVNVLDYLSKFDLLLLSSISEGQPLAVLEGMAAGIPWVTTDVGSCSELLYGLHDPYGQAGFIVPPVNPREMADKCKWFAENRREGILFGENGRKRAIHLYQLSEVIKKYREIYKKRGEQYGRYWV
ncbi:GT4 family glycosyltransferase PelF [Bacillus salitolerans]|uniref:GT4 family glycosyltransferase PelF n=1 Tax=Bacillus salitolerans TaxID=1437434 RepID=A0ABW4LKC5_9BACI